MNLLPATTITSAISPAVVTPWVALNGTPRNLTVQANFAYGSGGTSVDCYVQTSLDGKATATDIANFHFTTASARNGCNISTTSPAGTPLSSSTAPDKQTPNLALTDGAMSSNTAQDGILGPYVRVKYQSSGTYAGSTTLQVDVHSADIPAFP
jgi:hypothetical protein